MGRHTMQHYITLNYIKVVESGLSTRLLNHYCPQHRKQKQKTVNSYEGKLLEKEKFSGNSKKNSECQSSGDVR